MWLALGLLAILTLLPATGWLVRTQQGAELLVGRLLVPASPDRVAREHPDDYLLQQYSAVQHEFEIKPEFPGCVSSYQDISANVLPGIKALSARMPDHPGPYAVILRLLCGNPKFRIVEPDYFPIVTTRPHQERGLLMPKNVRRAVMRGPPEAHGMSAANLRTPGTQRNPPPRMFAPEPRPVATPAEFAEFDRAAAEGERLDPDNAYFSIMRSAGLYASHHDVDAVSAVLRAGSKSRWNDYEMDDIRGAFRLDEIT